MIPVGIHENVRVNKATKNDKGTLVIGFKKETGAEVNLLDLLNSANASSSIENQEQDIIVWPFEAVSRQGENHTPDNIWRSISETKDSLNHILLQYMTADKIAWDIMKDCGITTENMKAKICEQPVLNQIYNNMASQFISMMTPFLNDTSKLYRVLLVRTSKPKHFPALRKRFLAANPFMEPMSVPKEQSKLAFTKWEIANGFNSGEKHTTTDTTNPVEARLADQLFNLEV